MALLGDLLVRVGANIDGFERSMGTISQRLTAIDREAQKSFSGFDRIGQRLSDIGSSLSLGLTAPLAGLAAASVTAFGTLDSLERGLNTVTGSASKTAAQLADLREVAKLPGLGLQEAVQGSINLQTLGFSADKSKAILLQFGNAIASVGRGKEDLAEVIRQLGQLGARGSVTADNLKPIIERVPQVAKIIKDNFGPEALGNPAETFKKIGVSSEDLINKLIEELGKLPRVTGGIKNDFENLKDTVTISLGKIGASIAPFVSEAINVLVPAMEKMVNIFVGLPKPVQDTIIVFAGLAAAIGPILLVSGSLISAVSQISAAVTAMGGILTGSMGVAALGAIANAAIVAASAFAAFKLGEWAYKNIPGISALGDAIGWLILKIPGVERLVNAIGGVGSVVKPVKDLETQVRATEKALREQGVAVEQGGLTLTQYASKLADLKKAHGDYAVVVDDSAAKAKASAKAHETLKSDLEAQEKVLTELKKAYDLGAASADQLAAQEDKIYKIMRQLHPEWEATRKYSAELMQSLEGSADAFRELGESAFKSQFQIKSWSETLGITNDQIGIFARSYPQLIDSIERESEALAKQNPLLSKNYANMKDLDEIIRRSQRDIMQQAKEVQDLTREYGFLHDQQLLGITDNETLARRAADVQRAYENVTRSVDAQGRAIYGLGTQRLAEIRNLQEQIRLQQALGNDTTALQLKMDHLSEALARQNDGWTTTIRNMRSVTSSGITQLTHDLIFQFDKLGDTAKRLGEAMVTIFVDHIMQQALKPALDMMDNLIAKFGDFITKALGLGGSNGPLSGDFGIPGLPNGGIGSPSDFPKLPGIGGDSGSGVGSTVGQIATNAAKYAIPIVGLAIDAISGVVQGLQMARQEGTLNAIEQHTKVMAIAMVGISAPWEKAAQGQDTLFEAIKVMRNSIVERLPWVVEFTHQSASALKDFIQPNIAMMTSSLRALEQQALAPAQVQAAVSTNQTVASNITINVNGTTDPYATAKLVMDELKTLSPVFV